jgi:hypothetical protein
VSPRSRELFAHLAVALGRYSKEIQRDGIPAPAELLMLAEFFTDCASTRQDATSGAIPGGVGDGVPMSHLLLTKREAAAELRLSVRQLERVLADETKGLAAVRVDGAIRLRRADLDAYVASLAPRSFRDDITEKGA